MTLTTHAIVGAAAMTATVAAVGQTPTGLALGFAAGFASHFVIDAIPHWAEGPALLRSTSYNELSSVKVDMITGEHALRDLSIISTDGLIGLFLSIFIFSYWLFSMPIPLVFLGAAAGESPDALQFVYLKTRLKLMEPLQKFHLGLQKEYLGVRWLGIEIALIAVVVGVLKLFI